MAVAAANDRQISPADNPTTTSTSNSRSFSRIEIANSQEGECKREKNCNFQLACNL